LGVRVKATDLDINTISHLTIIKIRSN